MNAPKRKYLLRLEGVNLSNVLDDTPEISVRRGASLMLRQAVIDIAAIDSDLVVISTGASIGLYEFKSDSDNLMKQKVSQALNENYPHLTFVVDTIPFEDDFRDAHEKLITRNRYHQFLQSTIVPPISDSNAETCCDKDFLRPAVESLQKGSTKYRVSKSVFDRFKYGQKQRQQFYENELKTDENKYPVKKYSFTNDLEDIARSSGLQDYGNLNDKMAVIYLDGNGFGKIQSRCNTPDELRIFDTTNQSYRRDFLYKLLAKFALENIDHNILMETLLWGGDEMLFVVPAWKGMETIQFFYEISHNWQHDGTPLTHAGGIVFCHYKTPISQVIRTAKALAETVKTVSRNTNKFEYLVLESIDYPTQSLNDFWNLRYGKRTKQQVPSLKPATQNWQKLIPELAQSLEQLPRGAIYDIGKYWVEHWQKSPDSETLADRITRFKEVNEVAYNKLFADVFPYLVDTMLDKTIREQHNNPGWLHLVELWDYLAPTNSIGGGK